MASAITFMEEMELIMRKWIVICFILILSLSLFSCSDVYEETIISDVKKYDDIWSLTERRANDVSALFPSNINEEQCVEFNCRHTTYQLLGTSWQIVLKIKYDDASFSSEINRLNDLCESSPVCGYSEYFDNLSYATVWNWNSCFEYAIVDEKEKTVCYIYLQLVEENDLLIERKYIPNGYKMQLTDSKIHSVYEE